jgi:4-oxalocrotonate tautomerase family enzyme
MPILEYHLSKESYSDEQIKELLEKSTELYAKTLNSPLERVRVFANFYEKKHIAVAGKLISEGGMQAPYFHFLVLEGRPLEECHKLLEGFTELVIDILKVERSYVRGGCWPIPPQYWAIGGVPASIIRNQEIEARKLIG